MQAALCQTLPESSATQEMVQRLIRAQFAGHAIMTDHATADSNIACLLQSAQRVLVGVATERVRHFISCAIQHLRCLAGLSCDSTPLAYLASEPTVEQIRRHWRLGCGSRAVNEKAYWKLPPREVVPST
jgi:hypothetical protein